MVGVAQLVELSVVVRVVAGSNPVAHPIFIKEVLTIVAITLETKVKTWFSKLI